MSKKKKTKEYYVVDKDHIDAENGIARYDIHVYMTEGRSFVLKAETEKEAKSIVMSLWTFGKSKDLMVKIDDLIAISTIPRWLTTYSFTQYKMITE